MRGFGFWVLAVALLLVAPITAHADDPLASEWQKYRDRFIADDGRVRDTGNKDISHTEGQGAAMLFAEALDDRATFDRVWGWTRDTLHRPGSALFAWRWDPNGKTPIADSNNATDGDMLIAWALALAGHRWHVPDYDAAAHRIIVAIREKLIARVAGRLVLLPGSDGFEQKDGSVIVNPSYYIYPALEVFRRLDHSAEWGRLRRDGQRLLARSRFGEWGLPVDWVSVDKGGKVVPDAQQQQPRFGFDAIRIPLYLIWGGAATAQLLAPMMKFWDGFGDKPVPAWIDVTSGAVAPFPAPSGFLAIIGLVRARLHAKPPALPLIAGTDDYYSASLILLADLAQRATGRRELR